MRGYEEQLWRLAQFYTGFIHYYATGDIGGMLAAQRRMNDTMSSMVLSRQLALGEHVRQEQLLLELQEGGTI